MDAFITFLHNTLSGFMILFAVIDITGSVPLIVAMLERGQTYKAGQAALWSIGFFLLFLFLGKAILGFLGVDFSSFAVAGALVMFALAIEMIFDIKIFKGDAPSDSVTLVPLVFPLIAGPGSITTMISLKTVYSDLEIITAMLLNVLVVYLVLRNVHLVQRLLGKGGIYAMRKFFGIVLMAVSVKMMTENLSIIISQAGAIAP